MICPNCGNIWDKTDPENRIAADAGQRSPITVIEFVNQELDEAILKCHCVACSQTYIASYKEGRPIEVHAYIKK